MELRELQDILSNEEIQEYHNQWSSFSQKYKPESEYNVHSGLPVIGKVFQYKNKPIFRAHIFKRKLQKAFDPYFISKNGYLHQYFHTVHYFFPIEQIFHASMSRIFDDYNSYITVDRLDSRKPSKMSGRIDFYKTKASIQLIPNVKMIHRRFFGKANFTFYDDSNNSILQTWYAEGIGEQRKYVQNLQRLKDGDKSIVENLIREIEDRAREKNKLSNPRLFPSKDELIEKLRNGEIPEQELHDFFSFWDKPKI